MGGWETNPGDGVGCAAQIVEAQMTRAEKAEEVIAEANNSLFGSQGFFMNLDGSNEPNKYHLASAIEDLKARVRAAEARSSTQQAAIDAVLKWAASRCPCENEEPDPCPLCGATVAEGACKAIDQSFPSELLNMLRAAQ